MHRKKFVFFIILVLLACFLIFLSIISFKDFKSIIMSKVYAKSFENFESYSPFSINKIVYFSSANGQTNINQNSSFNISNLYQYTDIAIFLSSNGNGNFNNKNTLKKVTLTDINFSLKPSIGTPNLYFKNLNDFTSDKYEEKYKLENNFLFETSSEDKIDYSKPILFNNCANPITLCYVNSNIINNYTLSGNISNIAYDGSLLKNCNITLNSIACKISFLITIINNLDESYICPVTLSIPLSTENSTIYDGNLVFNSTPGYSFIKK